jgi:hypothetical protein
MDSIYKFMRDNYRWGIKEFLHAYITEEADEQLSDSVQTRVRKLNEAIYEQKKVLKAVEDHSKLFSETGFMSLLREDIDTLRTSSVHYGRYKREKSLEMLDMKHAVDELKTKAPLLYQTLDYLMTAHRDDYARKEDLHHYRAVMLCSIICFTRAAKTLNFILSSLGLYL